MLVLTRKNTEEIRIGNDIRIKVLRCATGGVKLGIDAPQDVRVLRAELCVEPAEAGTLLEDALDEESDQAEGDETESGRLPEINPGDLAHFAALIYPQAV